jgi:hypothetical protein
VYTHGGSFKVFASPTEVAGALILAAKTGEPVELALGGTHAKSLKQAEAPMKQVQKITGVKVVTSGGWAAPASWLQHQEVKKLGSGK